MPDTIVIGNSRPFAPWMVRIRTASSSVSGSTVSTTRAPSALWRSAQRRKSRKPPPARLPGGSGRLREGARLVDHEPDPAPQVARAPVRERDFQGAALAHDAIEELARPEPQARVVPRRERAHRLADGMVVRQRLGQRRLVVPVPVVVDAERVEVVVAASEER